jgi:DNA processing protein
MYDVLGRDLKNEAFRAARLWRYEFDPRTDLVISPFRPSAGYHGVNNQLRDRLVAGISKRIDIVHLSPGGNMDKLAKLALKCQRRLRVPADSPLLTAGAEPLP